MMQQRLPAVEFWFDSFYDFLLRLGNLAAHLAQNVFLQIVELDRSRKGEAITTIDLLLCFRGFCCYVKQFQCHEKKGKGCALLVQRSPFALLHSSVKGYQPSVSFPHWHCRSVSATVSVIPNRSGLHHHGRCQSWRLLHRRHCYCRCPICAAVCSIFPRPAGDHRIQLHLHPRWSPAREMGKSMAKYVKSMQKSERRILG